MRVAGLFDVHGNLAALDAVLAELDEVDVPIVCGGDLLGGSHGRECLDRLQALGDRVTFVRGNADREVPELASLVATWPLVAVVEGVTFCHATPVSDEALITAATPDGVLRDTFTAPLTVVGHTHVQFDRTVDGKRVVNAGSVGMPYEAAPGAYWALVGDDVALRRTEYDGAPEPQAGPDEATAYFEGRRGA